MTLAFATFNLKNLQSPGRPMYSPGKPYTAEAYVAKLEWTSRMLARLDADAIGFQEAWSVDSLTDALTRAGMADRYTLIARDAEPGRVQVALAVRKTTFEVGEHAWTETVPEDFRLAKGDVADQRDPEAVEVRIATLSRPPLVARLRLKKAPYRNREIAFWVTHLKSKRPMTPLDRRHYPRPKGGPDPWALVDDAIGSALSTVRRAAEAAALRMMLTAQMAAEADLPTVLVGDLNDSTLSVTTTLVTGNPAYKLWAKSTAGTKGMRAQLGLYTAETLQQYRSQRDVYYTHVFENRMESLDHVLVSRHFYDHSPERMWSFRELRGWNDHLHESRGKGGAAASASDHAVIEVHFDNNPAPRIAGAGGAAPAAHEPED